MDEKYEDIMALTNIDKSDDSLWITIFLLLFAIGFPSCDPKLELDVAELKGKMSVIEKLVIK